MKCLTCTNNLVPDLDGRACRWNLELLDPAVAPGPTNTVCLNANITQVFDPLFGYKRNNCE